MSNSNVFTKVHLTALSGKGPSVSITLYHNSIAAVSELETTAGCGFNLGEGWSMSYSSQIVRIDATTLHLIEDDGAVNVFVFEDGAWKAPPGVHDVLTYDAVLGWTLRRKNQFQQGFDGESGRLRWVRDGGGNQVTVNYDGFPRVSSVSDAAGRSIVFLYAGAYLTGIRDGLGSTWSFERQIGDRLSRVYDPAFSGPGPFREFTYTESGRFEFFNDRNGNAWRFDGKTFAFSVFDPPPFQLATAQVFLFPEDVHSTPYSGTYYDRRGGAWTFTFDDGSPLARTLKGVTDPLGYTGFRVFDDSKNLIRMSDELSSGPDDPAHTWTFTYDDRGNRLTATDPLGHTSEQTYDIYNNVTSAAPPADASGNVNENKRVVIEYQDPHNPTLPTRVVEPPDGFGLPTAETHMAYHPTGHDAAGRVHQVVDANAVRTTFHYDAFGQPFSEDEAPSGASGSAVQKWLERDAIGRPIRFAPGAPPGPQQDHPCWNWIPANITYHDRPSGWRFTGVACPRIVSVCPEPSPPPGQCPPAPALRPFDGGSCGSFTWDQEERPLTADTCLTNANTNPDETWRRNYTFVWNAMGLLDRYTLCTSEPEFVGAQNPPGAGCAGATSRELVFTYDFAVGVFTRTGPDGQTTRIETDDRGLTALVRRGTLEALYSYTPDRRVDTVTFNNGTRTRYEYDPARRLMAIVHEQQCSGQWRELLALFFTRSADGLITEVVEREEVSACSAEPPHEATITYVHDNRDRLVQEARTGATGQPGWNIAYGYDQLGNRLRKTEGIDTVTEYDYDVGQHGNRLLGYTVYAWPNPLWRVTFSDYNRAGNPTRMLLERIMAVPGLPRFERTTFYYDTAQRLWMTLKETWDVDGQGNATNCVRLPFREFRYEGGGRSRYLTQTRESSPGWDFLEPLGDALWTDYDGDEPYVDYLVNASDGQPVNQRRYLPGLGHFDDVTGTTAYVHGDQVGTLRRLTDGVTGATLLRRVHTAFGQQALSEGPTSTRYGYAGAFGYESFGFADLPFIHVGERWYDPASGRFLQRDPIGIDGGLNVYAYAENCPIDMIDPEGLESCAERMWRMHDRAIMEGRYADARDIRIGMGVGAMAGAGLVAAGGAAYVAGPALAGAARTAAASTATAAASHHGIQHRIGNVCLVIRLRWKEGTWALQKATINLINRTSGNRVGIGYDQSKGIHIDRKGK